MTVFLIILAVALTILLLATLFMIIGVNIRRSGLVMGNIGQTIEFTFDNQKISNELLQDVAAVSKELFPKNPAFACHALQFFAEPVDENTYFCQRIFPCKSCPVKLSCPARY